MVRFDDTINAASILALFKQTGAVNEKAGKVYIICDNARYYRSKDIQKHLEKPVVHYESTTLILFILLPVLTLSHWINVSAAIFVVSLRAKPAKLLA